MIAPAPFREAVPAKLYQALAMFKAGDMDGAENLYSDILRDDPGNPHAMHILGLICRKRGDYDLAEQLVGRACQLEPHSRVWLNLGVIRQHRGNLDAAIACYRRAIELEPEYAEAWANLIFALDMHPYASWKLLRETRRAFDTAICSKLTALSVPHENDRDPNRRLKVGYLSAEFSTANSAALAFGWITAHDPDRVETYLYSTRERHDARSDPFKSTADVWSEVENLTPQELVQAIREDGIDILVDLGGAAMGGRPYALAMKPAPIQIGGWGYANGLGLAVMDYLAGDDVTAPPEHAERYAEKILRLPINIPYTSVEPLPPANEAPEVRNGYRTYGYLGRGMKATAPSLAIWAAILRADRFGRLLLKSPQYGDRRQRDAVIDGLTALGADPARIEVRGRTSRSDHLLAHRDIDVALDPLVHGGGATIWDAAAMGVPTVTLPGEVISGRQGAAIMTLLGATDWIVDSVEAYVRRAVEGPPGDRAGFQRKALASVGCNARAYAAIVEDAYRACWRAWATREDA